MPNFNSNKTKYYEKHSMVSSRNLYYHLDPGIDWCWRRNGLRKFDSRITGYCNYCYTV